MAVTHTITASELADIVDLDNATDYDYPNSTEIQVFLCQQELAGLQVIGAMFQPVLYSLIFLLGMAGNGLMITVLLRRWRFLRITEIYLLHLALADLMLLATFPFSVAESVTGWLFGEFLCKLLGLMKNLNLVCGSFLLACIGFDRYLAIVHAIPSMRSRRPRTVHLTCLVLWLVCFGLSVPHVVFLKVTKDVMSPDRLSCYYYQHAIHAHNWVVTKRVLDNLCFFLPLGVMSYCYTAVVITLCNSQKSQAKQGAIRLALLITIIFCVCWLPYNVTLLVQTITDFKLIVYERCETYKLMSVVLNVAESLGLLHCLLNPFLYAFVGVQFRNELIQLLCELGCGRVCLPSIRARGHSRPSVSDATTTISSILI